MVACSGYSRPLCSQREAFNEYKAMSAKLSRRNPTANARRSPSRPPPRWRGRAPVPAWKSKGTPARDLDIRRKRIDVSYSSQKGKFARSSSVKRIAAKRYANGVSQKLYVRLMLFNKMILVLEFQAIRSKNKRMWNHRYASDMFVSCLVRSVSRWQVGITTVQNI
jgi:hypothetical protein